MESRGSWLQDDNDGGVEAGLPDCCSPHSSGTTNNSSWLQDTKNEPGMKAAADVEDNEGFNKGYDDDDESKSRFRLCCCCSKTMCIICCIVVSLAAIAIGVVFALYDKDNTQNSPAEEFTGAGPCGTEGSEVRDAITGVALFGGSEFEDTDSYQCEALRWVISQSLPSADLPSLSKEEQAIQLYALACILYNTDSVESDWTDFHFGVGAEIPGWFTKRGWLGEPNEVCKGWFGITCDENGRVSKIDLSENGLTGYFPPETSLLSESLTYLDLFNNLVNNKGDLGNSWLGKMTNLEYLFYGSTSFEYDGVPTDIGQLTKLKEYDMSYTLYFGELQGATFEKLTDLNYLVMDGNAYNSSLPAELLALPNLQYLYAGFAYLEGNLNFVPTMPAIFELWIDDNPGLAGTIPNNLPDAETLVSLSVTNCDLTGTLPTQLGQMTEMIQMWFYDNNLTGTIPTEYGDMVKMKILNVQKNDLVGDMPGQICTRRAPLGRLEELEADCDGDIVCPGTCCTCCGETCIAG